MPEQAASKTLQLPCGLGPDKEGKVHREAEIIPMTGLVRKNIARPEVRQNLAKIVDVVLLACLKKIGPMDRIDRRVLDKLLIGDRDQLLVEIRRLSLGDVIHSTIVCGSCNQKSDITFHLDRLTVRTLPDKGDGIEVVNGERVFTIDQMTEDERYTIKGKFRFPNGSDQTTLGATVSKNPVEAAYQMYMRCLVEWDGQPVEKVSGTLFEDSPLPVVDAVDAEFRKRMPGPDLDQKAICSLCGAENEMDLRASDFLFPQVRGKMPSV